MKNCKSCGQELPKFDIEKHRGKKCYVWHEEKPCAFLASDILILCDYLPNAVKPFIVYQGKFGREKALSVIPYENCQMIEEE